MIPLNFFMALPFLIFSVCGSSLLTRQLPKNNFKFPTQSVFGKANWFQNSWGTSASLVSLFPKTFSTSAKDEKEPSIFQQEFWKNNKSVWGEPEWRVKGAVEQNSDQFSSRPYKIDFFHPSEGKRVTILVIPVVDLGNPLGFHDVLPENGIDVEIMKESLISKKIVPLIQKEYPGINWVIFEKVVANGKSYGNYCVKGLETVVPQNIISEAAAISPALTNQGKQKKIIWTIAKGVAIVILVIVCLIFGAYVGFGLFIVYLLELYYRSR
jgi:hypothetical protein